METQSNHQLYLAYEFVKYTNKNVFLTGKAGTGKTYFLRELKKDLPKRMVVVAPTGVAAINAGGVTIHSFFQMPFGPQLPDEHASMNNENGYAARYLKISREKITIIRSLDLLVIDEVSMVRADLLDGIDQVMRRFRLRDKPFGGVQLLLIGDLMQLPPVVKEDEWQLLKEYYQSPYFFNSIALNKTDYISIELQHVYRQSDQQFIDILNKIRENRVDHEVLTELNRRHIPNFMYDNDDGYIALTTHNYQSKYINKDKLGTLTTKLHILNAEIHDEFPEYSYPTEFELELKVGAQVMFIKNDITPEKRFYNGKIGIVSRIEGELVYVKCKDNYSEIPVERMEWQNMRYTIDRESKQMVEKVIGTFRQYPLKCAWAVTIHKCQGLTFDKAVIDSSAAFAHGQVYVALSRCKTIEGLVLNAPVTVHSIKTDSYVIEFMERVKDKIPDKSVLEYSKKLYNKSLCLELFCFEDISKSFNFFIKKLYENSKSIPEFVIPTANTQRDNFRNEIITISEKFASCIDQLIQQDNDIENNSSLQDYIRRACPYFTEKLNSGICTYFESLQIETDNKKVNRMLTKIISQMLNLIALKKECLKVCACGFQVSNYLNTRVNAPIGDAEQKKQTKIKELTYSSEECCNHDLFTELKAWRAQKTKTLGIAPYMILSQKAMLLLTNVMPVSEMELKKIHGIGKKKIGNFGSELLEIIQKYAGEHKPDNKRSEKNEKPEKEQIKIPTKQISFGMFNDGKSIEEIADERNLVVSTIEGHLAYYIATGDLDIRCLLCEETIELIENCLLRLGAEKLSPVKESLGDAVTYGQIKMVQKYLEFKHIKLNQNVKMQLAGDRVLS